MRNKIVEAHLPAMRAFSDMPIKRKLMVIIMVTTTVALLLAGAGIVIADSVLFRGYLQRDLAALARIIADNSTAALAFEDPQSAGETLAALRARTHIVSACIYRGNGTVLATYFRSGAISACPPARQRSDIQLTSANLTVSHPILLNDRRIAHSRYFTIWAKFKSAPGCTAPPCWVSCWRRA